MHVVRHRAVRHRRAPVGQHHTGERRGAVVAARRAGCGTPPPANADSHGCGWPVALNIPVSSDWSSGCYLVTLHAQGATHDRAIGHAMFVVRAKRATGNLLLVLATNTYNAHEQLRLQPLHRRPPGELRPTVRAYGMLVRPHTERDDRKSRPTHAGEDPDVDGVVYQEYRSAHGYPGYMSSAGWFTYERRFVEWAERNGIALDYAVSSDLQHEPAVVNGYRLVLGVGHDEYWSAAQRDTIEAHVAAGGNYASLSGNTMFWQVRLTDHGRSLTAQVLRPPQRPRRGHRGRAHDERHVVRPAGRPAGVALPGGRFGVRPLQPLRPGHPASERRLHGVPRRSLAVRRHRLALRRPAGRSTGRGWGTRPSACASASTSSACPSPSSPDAPPHTEVVKVSAPASSLG